MELSRRLGAILTADAATEPLVEYIRRREFRRRHWGEQRYKGAFSLVALAGLALIVGGYAAAAPGARLFQPSRSAIVLAPYAITLSFVLLAAANLRGHIRRVLKHPMLIAIAIWAAVHLLANGDTKGTVLFASILAYALVDFVSAVQRHATKLFAPSARHDAMAVAAGIVAALAVMALHRVLFGAAVGLLRTSRRRSFVAMLRQIGMMLFQNGKLVDTGTRIPLAAGPVSIRSMPR